MRPSTHWKPAWRNHIRPDAPRSKELRHGLAHHHGTCLACGISESSCDHSVERSDAASRDDLASALIALVIVGSLRTLLYLTLAVYPSSPLVSLVKQKQEGGTHANDGRCVCTPSSVPSLRILEHGCLDISNVAGFVKVGMIWPRNACIVYQDVYVANLFLDLLCGCSNRFGVGDVALDCGHNLIIYA